MDIQEEMGLIALEREIMEIEGKLGDLFMSMEIEERPRFREPMEEEYRVLMEQHERLMLRWLA